MKRHQTAGGGNQRCHLTDPLQVRSPEVPAGGAEEPRGPSRRSRGAQRSQQEEQRSPEVTMEEPRASNRRRTSSDSGGWTAVVGISLGLLFITQASLNVFLRLYFPSNKINTSDCTDVTAEKGDLGKPLNTCQRSLFLKTRELEEKISYRYLSGGWMSFSGSLYLGSTTKRNWFESRQFCQDQGADLAIITNVQEKDFISSIYKDRRWIGLSDMQEEGVWRWVDGTKLTTSFWMSSEPSNDWRNKGEDCVEINYNGQLGKWNDANCGVAKQFICERRLDDL
uniref:C-type lectin domain-containing protein n=1 Tax=Knipowitschia caucasica TaxID=637954 RepID=A0AAV2MFT9_KNICA